MFLLWFSKYIFPLKHWFDLLVTECCYDGSWSFSSGSLWNYVWRTNIFYWWGISWDRRKAQMEGMIIDELIEATVLTGLFIVENMSWFFHIQMVNLCVFNDFKHGWLAKVFSSFHCPSLLTPLLWRGTDWRNGPPRWNKMWYLHAYSFSICETCMYSLLV